MLFVKCLLQEIYMKKVMIKTIFFSSAFFIYLSSNLQLIFARGLFISPLCIIINLLIWLPFNKILVVF